VTNNPSERRIVWYPGQRAKRGGMTLPRRQAGSSHPI